MILVDAGIHLITDPGLAAQQVTDMEIYIILFLRIGDLKHCPITDSNLTDIPDLAARFRIKRSTIQDDDCIITIFKLVDGSIVLQNRQHPGVCRAQLVTEEFSCRIGVELEGVTHRIELAGGTGARALRLHFDVEAILVQHEISFASDVGGQVNREAKGIVKLEHGFTVDGIALHFFDGSLEDTHALLQGFGKTLFFLFQHAFDMFMMLTQFGVGIPHFLVEGGYELVEKWCFTPKLMAMPGGAANDSAQHITAPLVGGQHAVDHQKRAGANVVCNDAQ